MLSDLKFCRALHDQRHVGKLCHVVFSTATKSQKFFPSSTREAVITAHCITRERHYLAVGERLPGLSSSGLGAAGQPGGIDAAAATNRSSGPSGPGNNHPSGSFSGRSAVHVYGLPTFRRRKTLSLNEIFPIADRTPKEVCALSFNSDSRSLAILTNDFFLSYWSWEKGRSLASVILKVGEDPYPPLPPGKDVMSPTGISDAASKKRPNIGASAQLANWNILPGHQYISTLAVVVNPNDEEQIAVHARGLLRLYRAAEGKLVSMKYTLPFPESAVHSFAWLSGTRCVVGANGAIHIVENGTHKVQYPLDAGAENSSMAVNPSLEQAPVPAITTSEEASGNASSIPTSPTVPALDVDGGDAKRAPTAGGDANGEFTVDAIVVSARLLMVSCGGVLIAFERNNRDHADLLKAVCKCSLPMSTATPSSANHASTSLAASSTHVNRVKSMLINVSEETLLVACEDGACYMINISLVELAKGEQLPMRQILPSFHAGPITGMDVAVRKPIVATSSQDRSVRLWNFTTFTCELAKSFPEEPMCIAIHPTGYYLLIGFPDKLRLMTILPDDLRIVREFPVRGCRECAFARGGHLFSAVQGSVISVFNVWTFDLVTTLKAHNGRIRSLYWTRGSTGSATSMSVTGTVDLDDARMVSCGADGAVYTWVLGDRRAITAAAAAGGQGTNAGGHESGQASDRSYAPGRTQSKDSSGARRDNEYILKGVSFSSAVDVCGTTYAIGSDRYLRVITDSLVAKEIRSPGPELTQIAVAQAGRMMFVGTSFGTIKALRCPLPLDNLDMESDGLMQEHFAHAAPINRLRVTFDDRYLISTADDGCISVARISDRDSATRNAALATSTAASSKSQGRSKVPDEDKLSESDSLGSSRVPGSGGATMLAQTTYADEVIVTKSDLEEKTAAINELRTRLEEIKIEHDYQLRLKDMHLQDKIKELSGELTKVIESLKISTVVLRSEKDKEEAKHKDDYQVLLTRNQRELREMENRNNQQLMAEYEKFQSLQDTMRAKQAEWEKRYKDFEEVRACEIQEYTNRYEQQLQVKSDVINKLQEEIDLRLREFTEHQRQQAEDVETEISQLEAKYEGLMKAEREVSFRYKGENGIMKKKFLTLNKEIEDNKIEMAKLRDNENRLRKIMASLEREVDGLKRTMMERDKVIQEQERRVYELKKNNQELEKYKFVLDHKIKDLKRQIEPREEKIAEMKKKIVETNSALSEQRQHEETVKKKQSDLTEALASANSEMSLYHRKIQALQHQLKQVQTDLTMAIQYIQDPPMLKKTIANLHAKYCQGMPPAKPVQPTEADIEMKKQDEQLRETIKDLKTTVKKQSTEYRMAHFANVQENKALISEIRQLRQKKETLPPINLDKKYSQVPLESQNSMADIC